MQSSKRLKICIVSLFIISITSVMSQRAKDYMYSSVDGVFACFRRLNGTHQFGCTSSRSGNIGVVHIVDTDEDLNWLIKKGLAPPYIAILRPSMFTRHVMSELMESNKVNGVVLVNNGSALDRPSYFSHEDSCPNRYSGLSTQETQTCGVGQLWNANGTSMMLTDWGFPIFYATESSHIENIYECANKHNFVSNPVDQLDRSLCALQLNSHMFAAIDSEKCMRRSSYYTLFNRVNFCDPLGGRNIWQVLFPRSTHPSNSSDSVSEQPNREENNRSIAVLAARMDASTMFDGLVPGSLGAVTSFVTLITTAQLLHKILPEPLNNSDKNVMFVLLTGESYDYIGSSRMVYDMKQGLFPVKPDPNADVAQPPPVNLTHLGLFLELSQIDKPQIGEALYIHRTKESETQLSQTIKTLKRIGNVMGVNISDQLPPSNNLPPASLQTFLAADPDLPGLVLTDHESQYKNKYYHSVLDDASNLKYHFYNGNPIDKNSLQVFLANLSSTIAYTLFEHVTNASYKGDVRADAVLVDELLHCYVEQSNCSLFRAAYPGYGAGLSKPLSLYVGVSNYISILTALTGAVMALLTGEPTQHVESQCYNNVSSDQVYQYVWMSSDWRDPNSTKVCMKTTMNFTSAISPAFVIEGYNMSSGEYSTWTESVWPELSARMFLKPSFRHEVLTLVIGICVILLSFVVVYFIKARRTILFNPGLPST